MPGWPGQPSLADIHRAQHSRGQLPARKFFIFGNNIAHSLSPTIHNAAFAELGLPHHYSIHQTPEMDDSVRQMLHQPNFGGASVTFPHKLHIKPMLDSVSDSAMKLGAINTVVVEDTAQGRKLKGDNTDWLGILQCIQNAPSVRLDTAIVIGAGGAARAATFALQTLGVAKVVVINRTVATAQRLAADFPLLNVEVHSKLSSAPAANIIVACIPADDINEADIPAQMFADGPGTVIEMAYRPPVTALIKVARKKPLWKVYGGVDVLKEQAYAQFELWTGWRAPVIAIQEALEAKATQA
jgi:shikimate-5-dehydrogenase